MTGVLARRGYNVQSLAVGNCESFDLSRITTVIPGTKESSSKLIKQLLKLIHVHSVSDLSDLPFITRELMLIKCRCKPSERKELIDLAEIFHGNICDVSRTTITLEVQGKENKMRAVQDLLEPYGKSNIVAEYGPCTEHLSTSGFCTNFIFGYFLDTNKLNMMFCLECNNQQIVYGSQIRLAAAAIG